MTEALTAQGQTHVALDYRRATDAAGLCKDIVEKSVITIAKRKYVRVEGWQAIAVAHGCVGSAREVERIAGGVRAIGEVRRMNDGAVIAQAEGFVGDDEATWSSRQEYAKRAMAQTRAISRACRSAFAHVVVMMNAGLETIPAEEVEGAIGLDPIRDPQAKATPAATPAKGHEAAKPAQDGEIVAVEVGKVSARDGGTDERPWTRTYFKGGDGAWYSTFDTEIGAQLPALQGKTAHFLIKRGEKGNDILGIVSESAGG